MSYTSRWFAVSLLALIVPVVAFGQSSNGAVAGQVTDPSRAVVAQAVVRAVNSQTNVRYETQTNQSGVYVIPSLPPGFQYRSALGGNPIVPWLWLPGLSAVCMGVAFVFQKRKDSV